MNPKHIGSDLDAKIMVQRAIFAVRRRWPLAPTAHFVNPLERQERKTAHVRPMAFGL